MAVQIQFRRDTGSNWSTANTVLAEGEMGINTTTNQFKIGNGSTAWNSLSYAPISGTVADIDDVTNVTITSVASGDLLKYNGTAWVNAAGYATLASPTFTGTPAAPTAAAATNTTQVATTAFVRTEVANLVASAPAALDTLDELALALGDDANFASTVTTSIGLKAPLASPTFTGTPLSTTASAGTNTTQIATTAFVIDAVTSATAANTVDLGVDTTGSYVASLVAGTGVTLANNSGETATPTVTVDTTVIAALASPTFTGTPTIPTGTIATTQSAGNNTTAVATTAFVRASAINDQFVLSGQIF